MAAATAGTGGDAGETDEAFASTRPHDDTADRRRSFAASAGTGGEPGTTCRGTSRAQCCRQQSSADIMTGTALAQANPSVGNDVGSDSGAVRREVMAGAMSRGCGLLSVAVAICSGAAGVGTPSAAMSCCSPADSILLIADAAPALAAVSYWKSG